MPEILPNRLKLNTFEEVSLVEFEGFLKAELIQEIHKMALFHLYDFAGKWRNVNMSKGGFMFAPAQFLDNSMRQFESEFLLTLPKKLMSFDAFINCWLPFTPSFYSSILFGRGTAAPPEFWWI